MPWTDGDIERWVLALAGVGFAATGDRFGPVPEDSFGRVDGLVTSEQLEGLLAYAIQRGDARLAPAQVEVVAAQHGHSMARSLHLERAALAASAVLESAGIGHALLKGVALANAVYPDAGQRPFADVDLLLDPQRFTAGIAALRAAGASRHLPEVRPGHDRRFAKDVPLAFESAALDLHRTLIAGPLGRRIPVVELLDRRRQIMIGGRAMAMLDLADAYVHAGLTAGAADVPARLITLRDMLELEAQPGFDADAVLARARVWGVEAALARAVVVLEDRLCPDVPPALSGWARRYVAGRIDRFVLRCYTVSARSYRPQLAEVAFVPTWNDRAALLHALAVPQRPFLRARGWTLRQHLGRAARKLIR